MTAGPHQAKTVLRYCDAATPRDALCRTTPEGIHVMIRNAGATGRLVHVPMWARPLLVAVEVAVNLPLQVLTLIARQVIWVRLFRFRPAVEVEVTATELIVTDRRDPTALQPTRRWHRGEVAEFRPNRFGGSMWMRIPGREVTDVLCGLEQPYLEYLEEHVTPLFSVAQAET